MKTAGFSSGGPVSKFVTVAIGISRPSYDWPIERELEEPGERGRPRLERLVQLGVGVEAVEAHTHGCAG